MSYQQSTLVQTCVVHRCALDMHQQGSLTCWTCPQCSAVMTASTNAGNPIPMHPETISPIEKRLSEIAKLETNWDSYGALPLDQRAVDCARRVVAVMAHPPQIIPTSHGGVQLEWHRDGVDIEIVICDDGRIHSIYAEDA